MSSYSLHTANRHSTDRCPGFVTDLILRCAAGEEAALGSLFDHLYPMVASRFEGAAPAASSDALALATFRRLWDQAPTYDPKVQEAVEWAVSQAEAVLAEFLLAALPEHPAVLSC